MQDILMKLNEMTLNMTPKQKRLTLKSLRDQVDVMIAEVERGTAVAESEAEISAGEAQAPAAPARQSQSAKW